MLALFLETILQASICKKMSFLELKIRLADIFCLFFCNSLQNSTLDHTQETAPAPSKSDQADKPNDGSDLDIAAVSVKTHIPFVFKYNKVQWVEEADQGVQASSEVPEAATAAEVADQDASTVN